MDDFTKAGLLGVIEGVTEYLPISSTGHLIIFGELLSFTGESAKVFDVVIQVGAILSVVFLYREKFLGLLKACSSSGSWLEAGLDGKAGVTKLALVSLPALLAGALLHKTIKTYLFGPLPVAIALIVGALWMLYVEKGAQIKSKRDSEAITWKLALGVGCFQCLALWPGMSRSMATILGGMLLGLNRKAAAEFSFIAAVPILIIAALKDLYDARNSISTNDIQLMAFAALVAFVTALFVIIWFRKFLQNFTLKPFAWYRIALGLTVIALYITKVI